ncbi:unnamed protein product, partial [Durusdinium trenchii]
CMDLGLEVDLARILYALENHLKQLQAMRSPLYHRDFKRVRKTLNYLQDLALLCQRPEPQGYMSAAITFMKWEESGRSDTFFQRDDLTEVGNEDKQREEDDEDFATGDEDNKRCALGGGLPSLLSRPNAPSSPPFSRFPAAAANGDGEALCSAFFPAEGAQPSRLGPRGWPCEEQ